MIQRFTLHIGALLAALLLTAPPLAAQTSAPAWQWAAPLADGPDTYLSDVALDAAGNTYAVGDFQGTISLGPGTTLSSHGATDVLLVKYSPGGALLWAQALGGPSSEIGSTIKVDALGNAYITGRISGPVVLGTASLTPLPGTDAFRAKVDAQGTVLWARGGGGSLALDAAGRLYEAAGFTGTITLGGTTLALPPDRRGNPGRGLYLACYDAQGQAQWARIAAVLDSASSLLPGAVCVSAAGVYVAGTFTGRLTTDTQRLTAQRQDVYAVRYDLQGNWLSALRAGDAGHEELYTAATDAAGHLYLGGTFRANTTFGSIGITGVPDTTTSFVAQYNAQGQAQWAETLPVPATLMRLATDASGRLYGAAYFYGTINWGGRQVTSLGEDDALVCCYSPQGALQWLQRGGGIYHDYASALAVDAAGSVRVVGYFGDEYTFGPGTFSGVPDGNPDAFVARLDVHTALAAAAPRPVAPLTLAPNPAHAVVQLGGVPAGSRVLLLDALGRVAREATGGGGALLSVRGLPPGLYAVRATDAQGRRYAGRLLVQ
ncbi:hypothetical protein [Hymenobacter edaphi]|uniref:Secretion system C-terminal sorting domain-containing protein n=1 Tax=Hymenobacter edaphi TaxID=2211146 RepID=A0A328BFK9_9BACT|nr:hypothetical protein [Hymenobacter edaphi]RAK65903.1 hypothetical protein DLM85_14430 [Hymenobacter edaphi]